MLGAAALASSIVACWAANQAARRSSASSRVAKVWRWLVLALALRAAAVCAQLAYEALASSPRYPSLADLLALSSYLPLLTALACLSGPIPTRRRSLVWLDAGIVALGGAAAFVYLATSPRLTPHGDSIAQVASFAFPMGDALVLVTLGTAMVRGVDDARRGVFASLGAAATILAAVDLSYGSIARHDAHPSSHAIMILSIVSAVAMLAAAWSSRRSSSSTSRPPDTWGAHWVPYAAMSVILAVALAVQFGRKLVPDVAVASIVVLSGTLVVLRQLIYQRHLRESGERLAHAQELAQLGSWEWDVVRDEIERSEEDLRLCGLDASAQGMSRRQAMSMVHPEDRERVEWALTTALRDARPFAYEARVVGSDGEVRTLLTRGDVEVRGGRVTRMRATHQDVTDRRRMEAQLLYQADHDPLTGLYNRRKFTQELERTLRYAARYERPGALVVLDIDNFKLVNDSLGHTAGDDLLKAVGKTIGARAREADVIARLGGDEFAIVRPETDESGARALVEDLRRHLERRVDGEPVHTSAGIVAFRGQCDLLAEDTLIAADLAINEAKEGGKDRVCVYHGRAGSTVTWISRIRRSLSDETLVLYGQPILDLDSGSIAYRELLIRMLDDDGSIVPPDAFLPTAEQFGLITEIDLWVTREGLRLARRGERVSLNLSAHSIGDERVLDLVRRAIEGGTDPRNVIFEITETAAMTNMQEAREFTEALVDLGYDVALDDFGTGFGSFIYLKHLPARYLKIDMEFVRDMTANDTDRAVVRSIADVAHTLGKLTIAEGVEDRATLEALHELGVDYGQGFHIGRPEPLASDRPPAPRRLRTTPRGRPLRKARVGRVARERETKGE